MIYKILKVTEQDDTITTQVEYDIEGTIVIVDVAHFQPNGDSDITLGITNRYTTEMYKIFPERIPPILVYEEPIIEESSILDRAIDGVNSFTQE